MKNPSNKKVGASPRDNGIRLAQQWAAALRRQPSILAFPGVAQGAALALTRTWGAAAHDVWSGQGTGIARDTVDAALVWLVSRGVLTEVTAETAHTSRYRLALSVDRLEAWAARELKPRAQVEPEYATEAAS